MIFFVAPNLVVLKHLWPFLFVCWGDKVTLHVKLYQVKMNTFDGLEAFQLSRQICKATISKYYWVGNAVVITQSLEL
jgi:hypothetical protein